MERPELDEAPKPKKTRKRKIVKKRSIMWKYFERENDEEQLNRCKLCDKLVKGNTSNLKIHVKIKHPDEFKKLPGSEGNQGKRKRKSYEESSGDEKSSSSSFDEWFYESDEHSSESTTPKMENTAPEVSNIIKEEEIAEQEYEDDDESDTELRCYDCNINFTSKGYLYSHLYHHIKQPQIQLSRTLLPPLKITLKSTDNNRFEIVKSPSVSPKLNTEENLAVITEAEGPEASAENKKQVKDEDITQDDYNSCLEETEEANVSFSPNFADFNGMLNSPESESGTNQETEDSKECSATESNDAFSETTTDPEKSPSNITELGDSNDYAAIPGAEPTPPPEPEYPKIRIKTTGLLRDDAIERCTITEITNDNQDPFNTNSDNGTHLWTTPSLEDPLKLPDSNDENIISLFNSNDSRAKDFGFTSSDSEYMSLDSLDNRNSGAMQLYNPNNQVVAQNQQNSLESLTGLPMQALAQQVSRMQPGGNGQMHQQNVLINIQQFPQAPQQPPQYQPPHMYHPGAQPPPMYPAPYPYHPQNMYYPPAPGYPPQHMQPPQPMPQMQNMQQQQQPPQMGQQPQQVGQQPQQMGQPQMNSQIRPTNPQPMGQMQPPQGQQAQQQQQQGQQMQYNNNNNMMRGPRPGAPRQMAPGQRMGAPRQPTVRQPMIRQRGPQPRGVRPGVQFQNNIRGPRPRMPVNNQVRPIVQSPVKRTAEQIASLQAKRKRLDVLIPNKNDNEDCELICTQPKNSEIPQIQNVQGGTSEAPESSIMHLSDSITLSVRKPPPKVEEPKKSDATAVANFLATRGITVTATPKPKGDSRGSASPPALNLNGGSVSIIPSAKTSGSKSDSSIPTVDLTDDTTQSTPPPPKPNNPPQKTNQRGGLPYRCDLCPAQYPNALGLSKHRQNYHKTANGICELGIPLINLKQAGILQRLSQIGIHNYIPMPSNGSSDGLFALPIISARNPGNVAMIGASQMLSLGPVRTISRPTNTNANVVNKQNQPNVASNK